MKMITWDESTDILVVGSGGGGMTAAVTAKDRGASVIIIEKGDLYGGSTAMSGGALWVPCNHLMNQAGIQDSSEAALRYLKAITKDRVREDRLLAYINTGPEMVRYLSKRTHVRFKVVPGYSDYYPDIEGSKPKGGRTIEPESLNARQLGSLCKKLRPMPTQAGVFGRIMLDAYEFHEMFDSSLRGRLRAARIFSAYFLNPGRLFSKKDTRLTLGNALIGRFRLSLAERKIPIRLNTQAKRLIVEKDRVVGIEARKNEKEILIRAHRGVILAAGGFEHNKVMRETYQRPPVSDEWTMGNPENTGDTILMGREIGAGIGFMDEAWWMSVTLVPGVKTPYMVLADRTLPGSIMVSSNGNRFTNEAGPYIDVVHDQYASHGQDCRAIPAFLIADHRFHKKYPLGALMSWSSPKKYIANGFVKSGDTLEELAGKCGIDPAGLVAEVKKFNRFAKTGKDLDFNRGHNAIDRYYSDPSVKPNPCLAPLDKPPFYAIEVFPGDLGTKGGLNTDAHARVLREDGTPIEGLYATGNCSSPVMGASYPGAGGTIGPSMTFGYIAALHAAG